MIGIGSGLYIAVRGGRFAFRHFHRRATERLRRLGDILVKKVTDSIG